MHSASHTVSLQAKINISVATIIDVILVEHVIQAFVKVFQVEQDYCSSCLHTNFDLVDIPANL